MRAVWIRRQMSLGLALMAVTAGLLWAGLLGAMAAPDAPLPGYRLETTWPATAIGLSAAGAIAAGPDGRIWLLDGGVGKAVAMGADGTRQEERPVPLGSLDLSPDPGSSDLYVARYNGRPTPGEGIYRIGRYHPDGSVQWAKECDCGSGTGIAASAGRVWFTDPKNKSMIWFSASDGRASGKVTAAPPAGGFPADLAVAPDETLFATDLVGGAVFEWPPPYIPKDFTQWAVVESNGPFRVGAGAQLDGEVLVAALHSDGLVRVHRPDGTLVARFYVPGEPIDITVGGEGRIYVLDEAMRDVRVYVPGPPPTPTPVPADPPVTRASCQITGTRTLLPSAVIRCGRTQVRLALSAACPPGAIPGADIAIVIDESLSMIKAGRNQPRQIDAAKDAAKRLLAGLDLRYHRAAIVGFSNGARLEQPLSGDRATLDQAITNVAIGESGTNIYAAVRLASDHLAAAGRHDALPVIVLLTDGDPTLPYAPEPGTAALVAAERSRARRTYVVTVGLGQFIDAKLLEAMASSPRDFYYAPSVLDLNRIYDAIGREIQGMGLTDLVIEDTPGPLTRFLPGSGFPPPLVVNDTLTWARPVLPAEGLVFTYTLSVEQPGRGPAGQARVRYTDADGTRRSYRFTEPELVAILPTATPGGIDPTPPAGPTPLPPLPPAPEPAECAQMDAWTVSLVVFPDTVGFGGLGCPGCNGIFDQGDHWAHGGGRAEASSIVITDVSGQPLWVGQVIPPTNGPARRQVRLCAPPPYLVNLARIPDGYVTCPNTPVIRRLEPKAFGIHHQAELRYGLWTACGLPTRVPPGPTPTTLPPCPVAP